MGNHNFPCDFLQIYIYQKTYFFIYYLLYVICFFVMVFGHAMLQIRKIAPEFYSDLPCHTSWVKVLWDFVFCSEIGLYSRVRRRAAVKHNMLDVIQHAE